MRNVTTPFKQESTKQENRPVYLYTVHNFDNQGTDLRMAGYDEDVTFDSKVYTKFPVAHEDIGDNATGEIDKVRVTLGNVSRLIQSYLEAYEWRGKQVSITMVWANQLNAPTNKLTDIYFIDEIAADVENVIVTCASKLDVMQVMLPGRRYSRLTCGWKVFKGAECGYAGSELTCNRTWQRCGELNNRERFGGFPATPVERTVVR